MNSITSPIATITRITHGRPALGAAGLDFPRAALNLAITADGITAFLDGMTQSM
jgi:hypothetical protein